MVDKVKQARVPDWQEHARQVARGIRIRVLEHTINKNGGYLSQACSSSEVFSVLYTKILNIGPSQAPMIPLPFRVYPVQITIITSPALPIMDLKLPI